MEEYFELKYWEWIAGVTLIGLLALIYAIYIIVIFIKEWRNKK